MKRYAALILLAGILGAVSPQDAFHAVIARYRKLNAIQGNFTQTICSEQLGYCQDFEGKFYMTRPNRLRFEVTSPTRQTIVSDGEDMWIYFPDSALVHKTPSIANPFFQLLLDNSEEAFQAEDLVTEDAETRLTLVPADSFSSLSEVILTITPNNYISALTLDDGFGTQTKYSLRAVKYNAQLSPKLFKFVPPAGATVLE